MAIRTVDAEWRGNLAQGSGRMQLGSGAFEGSYDFRSRLDEGDGTSPEEPLGAAHAGCFSIAIQLPMRTSLSNTSHTTANAHFQKHAGGRSTHRINLEIEASISNVTAVAFEEYAQNAEKNCPVSRALSGVDIHLLARLL
jgi:osmotically inducible protein OsmC